MSRYYMLWLCFVHTAQALDLWLDLLHNVQFQAGLYVNIFLLYRCRKRAFRLNAPFRRSATASFSVAEEETFKRSRRGLTLQCDFSSLRVMRHVVRSASRSPTF